MRRFKVIVALLCLLGAVLPANAGTWVDKSTSWSSLGGDGALVANGDDLYYFRGTSASKYNWAADTWSALASSTNSGYIVGRDPYTQAYNVDGQFYFYHSGAQNYFEAYDPGTDSWSTVTMPTSDSDDDYTKSWSQGSVYNSYDGKYYTMWTDAVAPESGCYYSAFDPVTETWSAISTFSYIGPGWSFWSFQHAETVGAKSYLLTSNPQSTSVTLSWYDFATSSTPSGGASGSSATYTLSSDLSTTECWGGVITIALSGTDIYVTGIGTSGWFLRYDTVTDTWEELESFTATGDGDSQCNHSMTFANGSVIVQDGSQFLIYQIPEPATMMLLGLGGVGLLIHRKR